ncbi:hypothetical protein H4K35_08575 [Myroides sp. NP-2]|uniref:hypothetical protein n=1 Tax=Myroides sp. NP-2 TaxID=2759945 RepID=UPI0015FC405B|nr:hypothetical protein [Myroides sp. NP-2]MBB1150183.1 hypothetical protein [Myroides sp. NP-2]
MFDISGFCIKKNGVKIVPLGAVDGGIQGGPLRIPNTTGSTVLEEITIRTKGLSDWLQGGKTFSQYKIARGGTETLAHIQTSTGVQRISTEFHHAIISQSMQRNYNLPNWMVNNRIYVWKVNTIQHSLIDSYRYNFLRAGIKKDVGWFGKYNWFTKF